jgi:hypothetical protein
MPLAACTSCSVTELQQRLYAIETRGTAVGAVQYGGAPDRHRRGISLRAGAEDLATGGRRDGREDSPGVRRLSEIGHAAAPAGIAQPGGNRSLPLAGLVGVGEQCVGEADAACIQVIVAIDERLHQHADISDDGRVASRVQACQFHQFRMQAVNIVAVVNRL